MSELLDSFLAFIRSFGIKKAESYGHEIFRAILIITVVILIGYHTYYDMKQDVSIVDISDTVKPGTIMYNLISEMDSETQKKYIKSLKETIEKKDQTKFEKYMKSISVALLSGMLTEYAINGNTSKPSGVAAKTVIYGTFTTLFD